MNSSVAEQPASDRVLADVVNHLSQDPLCLQVRHYPAANELAGSETLHLLVILERELTQAERRERVESLNGITRPHGVKADIIFSSPKVWRDLVRLVGPFTRIERESTIDWQRE